MDERIAQSIGDRATPLRNEPQLVHWVCVNEENSEEARTARHACAPSPTH